MGITKIKGLPVYKAVLADDGAGMTKISFVEFPAVEKGFEAYDADRPAVRYAVEDEEKRLAFGVVMRANYPIYRKDPRFGEYFITHSPEFIREMVEKYLADGLQNSFSVNHADDVDGIRAVQYFIKDSAKGIAPAGFEEIEDGSLFGEFHVLNDDVWAGIKDGSFKGFSIEVYEDIVPADTVVSTEKVSKDVLDYLDGYAQQHTLNEKDMKVIEKLKSAVAREVAADAEPQAAPAAYGSVSTDKGSISWEGDEDLKAGDEVFVLGDDGERIALEDGDYKTEDDKVIVVADGKVSEIRDAEAEVAPEAGQPEEAADEAAPAPEAAPEADPRDERINALEERIAALEKIIEEMRTAQQATAERVDSFAKQPAAPGAREAYRARDNKSEKNAIDEIRGYFK